MTRSTSRVRAAAAGPLAPALLAALAALALAASPAAAQSGDGFLFSAPRSTLTVRGGFDHASAGSELFAFNTNQLTLSRGDFSGGTVAADLAVRLLPRLDVVLGTSYSSASAGSEYRHFVDEDDLPIEQTTVFRRVPVTASLKAYVTPRGRSVGRLAWIPARYAAFVGAGGGVMRYSFRQSGDFVNSESLAVSGDRVATAGWAPTAHAFAGVDYSLTPRFALTGEGRYTWSKGDVGQDFLGFDRIDLSGASVTAGLSVRF